MAEVIEQGNQLVLKLSLIEKIFALHFKQLTVSKEKLIGKKSYAKPWSTEVLKGVRAPGTGFPYLILLGTMRYRGGKDFTAIYKKRPVTVYEFTDYNFKRWIVTE
ncbi:MAG: hypothetical protein F2658_04100 [Actinobacteria bacterium]|uniref:Unannotated protein n=1 Tax=freshwater metagenome TaxID=449393 RepID=A0A6J6NS63_9ZZZZ|nr:hypothetical protein [Actinomycetota bacterium]